MKRFKGWKGIGRRVSRLGQRHSWHGLEALEPRQYLTGTIAGTVFLDADADGVRDEGEQNFLGGATLFLDINGDGDLDVEEPQTDANGNGEYLFQGVEPGNYIVRLLEPDGFAQTGPNMDVNELLGLERLASNLDQPLYVTAAPGDDTRLFVAEQFGRILMVKPDADEFPSQFLSLVGKVLATEEQGLLGLAFDPDYQENGFFYVTYNNFDGDIVVERYSVTEDPDFADPNSGLTILTITPADAYRQGGWLGFGPDGFLYIGVGDGNGNDGNDPLNNAQNLNSLLGKMLRIDVSGEDDFPADANRNYAIPPDNPFVDRNGADEIWASGLRNPWRPSFDRESGDLYIADVGQDTREEVNFQPADSEGGENYGWRLREGSIATPDGDGLPSVGGPRPPGNVDPIHEYLHGAENDEGFSVTGGYVYRGPIEPLQGKYFFGDFVNPRIWSLEHDGETATEIIDWTDVLTDEFNEVNLISSFGEDNQGNLYVVDYGFGGDGEVFKLVLTSPLGAFEVTVVDEEQSAPFDFGVMEATEDVGLGDAGGKSVTWTDPDGTVGTATFKGGDANFVFSGDNLVQTNNNGKITVTGQDVRLLRVEMEDTDEKSQLTFKAKGGEDGLVTVEDLTADGPMGKIAGALLDVLGDITILGPLLSLVVNNIDADHTIEIGASENPKHALSFTANDVVDTDLTSGIGIKSIKVNSWEAGRIVAPWLSKVTAAEDFFVEMTLSGVGAAKETLGAVTAKGDIGDGVWDVNGAGGGKSITANDISNWDANFEGPFGKLTAKGDLDDILFRATLIKSVSVGGNMTDTNIIADGAFDPKVKHIGAIAVKLDILSSIIDVFTGNINSIKARMMFGTTVFAGMTGLDGVGLPSQPENFATQSFIKSVTLKNKDGFAFGHSAIAAFTLGKLNLGNIQTGNDGGTFGVGGNTIAAVTGVDEEGVKISLKKLIDPVEVFDILNEAEFDLGDMEIRVDPQLV